MAADLPAFAGSWKGTNRLYFEWPAKQEFVSDSELVARPAARAVGMEIAYTWAHEGKEHEGLLLIGPGGTTAAWMDSFHQSGDLMILKGGETPEGGISVTGHYEAPEGPPWGWRIVVRLDAGGRLLLEMDNITPTGEVAPAVRADYERS